jgi:hypothetical protein
VIRAETPTCFSVEIFVKEDEVAPMRITGETRIISMTWPAARRVGQEDTRQPSAEFIRDLLEIHYTTGTGGTLDLKRIAVEMMIPFERLDQQIVDGKPDRPAPVRIAAEEVSAGFARVEIDAMLHAVRVKDTRVLLVEFG